MIEFVDVLTKKNQQSIGNLTMRRRKQPEDSH